MSSLCGFLKGMGGTEFSFVHQFNPQTILVRLLRSAQQMSRLENGKWVSHQPVSSWKPNKSGDHAQGKNPPLS